MEEVGYRNATLAWKSFSQHQDFGYTMIVSEFDVRRDAHIFPFDVGNFDDGFTRPYFNPEK